MDDAYPVGDPMHMIFCRNVLIYFDKPTQAKVLTRLCDCLVPGGYLFIGHSESVTGIDLPGQAGRQHGLPEDLMASCSPRKSAS